MKWHLTIDAGNSQLVLVLYHRKERIDGIRLPTHPYPSPGDLSAGIESLLVRHNIPVDQAQLTVSSVVPALEGVLKESAASLKSAFFHWVDWQSPHGFSASQSASREIGADLISGLVGARQYGEEAFVVVDCGTATSNLVNQRLLTDALIEGMDVELGRLLQETGVAVRDDDGELVYQPDSNTVLVIVGDNGSLGTTVKPPFDVTRAKGTAYQTGVWVPLIVAGPMVDSPDRDVGHMVNATDVFYLFGEIAGLDVESLVPGGSDGEPLLPYLLDPAQPGLRDYNFAQGGLNLQAGGGRNGPCVIASTCSHTPVSKTVCEDNGGVWWGEGADSPEVIQGDLEQCWQVNQAIYQDDPANYEDNRRDMSATVYQAVRNEDYKLVRNETLDYDIATDDAVEVKSTEFYRVDQQAPEPLLDTEENNLLAGGGPEVLTDEERDHYVALSERLDDILASKRECPGDGNDDGHVDDTDLANFDALAEDGWSGSSVYDFNLDGVTDSVDRAIISDHLGPCP